jgi:flagellar biosynthesis anti-sigma factor FlgM
MIDKIQPNQPNQPNQANQANLPTGYVNNATSNKAAAAYANTNSKFTSQSAEVSFSDDALAMQRIMQAAQETPDVRADIVQQLKGDIEAGNYKVDVNSLADKLLPFMK